MDWRNRSIDTRSVRSLPLQRGRLRKSLGDLPDGPEVLHKGETQQPAQGDPEDDPGGQAEVPRERSAIQAPASVGAKSPRSCGRILRKEVVEEKPLARAGQDLPFPDQPQGIEEVGIGASLLPAAAEEEPAQDRRLLVRIRLKRALHEGFEAAPSGSRTPRGRGAVPGPRLSASGPMEEEDAQVPQPFAEGVHGPLQEGAPHRRRGPG